MTNTTTVPQAPVAGEGVESEIKDQERKRRCRQVGANAGEHGESRLLNPDISRERA